MNNQHIQQPNEIFISKTVHNTISIYIPYEYIQNINSSLWGMICIAMESWSIWKTNISDTHIGFEFSKDFTPEMIQIAFKKVSGATAIIK